MRGLWPDFRDQNGPGAGERRRAAASPVPQAASASAAMAPGDPRADLLLSGRLFRIRFAGNSAPTGCRIVNVRRRAGLL